MRYPAAEKLEIIQLVEQSHLPVRRVLEPMTELAGLSFSLEDEAEPANLGI
jgi:hypothetical protein